MNTFCKGGCGTEIFWAKHEKTGKRAPLCRPTGDMRPNIEIFTQDGETFYRIVKEGGEFVSHFSNCSAASRFRPLLGKYQTELGDEK